jgi:hypothetical protein
MKTVVSSWVAGMLLGAAVLAQSVDQRMLMEALSLARTRESGALARFHQAYQLTPADPRISLLEVITPFRRAVLLAQAELDKGNFVLTPTGLAALMAPYAGQTALRSTVSSSLLPAVV